MILRWFFPDRILKFRPALPVYKTYPIEHLSELLEACRGRCKEARLARSQHEDSPTIKTTSRETDEYSKAIMNINEYSSSSLSSCSFFHASTVRTAAQTNQPLATCPFKNAITPLTHWAVVNPWELGTNVPSVKRKKRSLAALLPLGNPPSVAEYVQRDTHNWALMMNIQIINQQNSC